MLNRGALKVVLSCVNVLLSQLEELMYKHHDGNLDDARSGLRTAQKALREYFFQSEGDNV